MSSQPPRPMGVITLHSMAEKHPTMNLNVYEMCCRHLHVSGVRAFTSIEQLKVRIWCLTGTPPLRLHAAQDPSPHPPMTGLFFELEDGKTVSDYNLEPGHTLIVQY